MVEVPHTQRPYSILCTTGIESTALRNSFSKLRTNLYTHSNSRNNLIGSYTFENNQFDQSIVRIVWFGQRSIFWISEFVIQSPRINVRLKMNVEIIETSKVVRVKMTLEVELN